MMYFVYLIQCDGGSIYTGITTDIKRRFKEHQDKVGGHYTRAHNVEKILYTEECQTRSEALKREAEIKKLSRGKKLELIKMSF
ncbi:MAG: GIY-YIG nuclease family protein [Patescibacteria group bacterium]